MTPAFEQARQYLARVLPWPDAANPSAFVNVHWSYRPSDAKPDDKPKWSGQAVKSLEAAVKAIERALARDGTLDIYACMSSQRRAIEKTSQKGFKYYGAMRHKDDAVLLKALFVDIDFKGGEHGYDTPEEASTAFADFRAATSMPAPSMVVHSGGGLHVYWVFMRALTPAEWNPLAFALAEATKRHGLKCDTQCTVDSARVLRIPDTLNRKQATPRKVSILGASDFDYTVEKIAAVLEPYKVTIPQSLRATDLTENPELFTPRAPIVDDEFSAGIDLVTKAPPVDLKTVAPECGFVKEALATGGATYTNPVWNLTTLLATFCDDGRAAAHLMARKHPGYTPESTDELYDRKVKERDERNLGWPSCRTISGYGSKVCQACPHFAKGKSPLNFAAKPALPTSTTNTAQVTPLVTGNADLPTGYDRNSDGTIVRLVAADAGAFERMALCQYPMQDAWLQKGPWAFHFMYADPGQAVLHAAHITFEAIGSPDMRKSLHDQGMTLHDGAHKAVTEFFVSWIDKLKADKAIVSTAPFGWSLENGKLEGFVYGGHMWMLTGSRRAPSPDPVTEKHYSPAGDKQPWLDAATMITDQGRPELDAVLATAFAGPLVRFTGQSGLLMSLYSMESGIGKTTTLKIAQAVWGDPVRGLMGVDDTSNSFIQKMGELRSLPMYWDELKTEEDTRKFVNDVFRTSGGKGKSRLSARVQQREVGTWQTLLVSASNESLVDYIASRTQMTTAGIYRIFEYDVHRGIAGQISPSQAQRMVAKLHDNYGNVGLEYAKYLGANFLAVDTVVEKKMRELEEELSIKGDERFWAALVSVLIVGGELANQLGFTKIAVPALKQFLITTLGNMRKVREAQPNDMRDALNVSNILQQFLTVMKARHTVYTDRIHKGAGKPPVNSVKLMYSSPYLDAVYVQIGVNDKLLRISALAFSTWLKECGLSRHMFTKALEVEFGLKPVNGRIAGGTPHASPMTEHLLELDLGGTAISKFVEL